MRRLLPALAALAFTLPVPPASAAGGVVLVGTAQVDCFGCGVSNGTASLDAFGLVSGHVNAAFTAHFDTGLGCPATWLANGATTGAVDVFFSWQVFGSVFLATTTGDVNGSGSGSFAITSPTGNPCGAPATARVTWAL